MQVIATDSKGNSDTASIDLTVVSRINAAPIISTIQKSVNYIGTTGTIQFTALATDPNNDPLTYLWTANGGTFSNATTRQTTWTAPNTEGVSTINLSVTDNGNLSATASTTVLVKNFNATPANLIAYYPFTGNTNDLTVNRLDGIASGIAFVPDRFNVADRAAYFNGGTQHVKVNNSPILNVTNAISVSCWFNPARLGDKEVFLLSHGSWQNRWKLSVTPEKNVRWTVNTLNAVADLDASFSLSIDSFYHVTATYDGSLMAIYINGQLKSYKPLTGNIRTTTLPFLIGQMLIDNADYNFKGIIDEVKLFDYALSPVAAASLYQQSITDLKDFTPPQYKTLKVSPNPVSNTLSIYFPFELINSNLINNSNLIDNSNSINIYNLINSKTIVQILNVNGQLVGEEEVQPDAGLKPASGLGFELNVSHLLSGIYVVLIKTNNVIATARFIKL